MTSIDFPNTSQAVVIIKASPIIGQKHGETVCVAGIDFNGDWHRLYPVPFKDLDNSQKFNRWDIIEFEWRKPEDDQRVESKRINKDSLNVVGKVKANERHAFAQRALVHSLDAQLDSNKSFALIRPENPRFSIERKKESELSKETVERNNFHSQGDLFAESIVPKEPSPFRFKYKFEFDGKKRNYNCIDWETEATFFKWREMLGEENALKEMNKKFNEEYPEKGMAFAMGTHRVTVWKNWLLSGIIRVDRRDQKSLF